MKMFLDEAHVGGVVALAIRAFSGTCEIATLSMQTLSSG